MADTETIQGLARGLRVIEAFGADHPKLSIAEAARLTGLDRATVRRCLRTLAELGYASFDGKYFALTQRVLRLGHAWLASAPLPAIVQPVLDRLAAATDESASVAVLDGTEIVYVARASRKRVMSIGLAPGSRLPAYCASMGRVLLAALPSGEAEALLRASALVALTPQTKTSLSALRAAMAETRETGFAVIDQELELGLRSIAVPLVDGSGRTVAALNVGAHAARLTLEAMIADVLPQMRAAQAEIGRLLG